ncbi:hypothetical protein BKA61DRAFT_657395, partial [Leptodontidium sp. MPI-SDFR-AT-0119]
MGSISDEKIQETFQEDIHDETPESAIYRKKEAKHVWKLDLLHCTSHNASHADQLSGSRKQDIKFEGVRAQYSTLDFQHLLHPCRRISISHRDGDFAWFVPRISLPIDDFVPLLVVQAGRTGHTDCIFVQLYIIEGIIIVVWVGICIYVVLKNYEAAYFLNEDDRVTMRRRAELAEAYSGGTGRYGMKDMKEAAKDTKSWLHGVIQICVVTILYGSGTFLPLMITNGFHYSTVQAQYLVIPVNLWGAFVYAISAYLSDKHKSRFLPFVVCALIGIVGFAILRSNVPPAVSYFATYLI